MFRKKEYEWSSPLRARGSPSGAEAPLGRSLSRRPPIPPPSEGEGVKKSIWFFYVIPAKAGIQRFQGLTN
jgi:hypothetical protein